MGSDINLCIEYWQDGKWNIVEDMHYDNRCYDLYALLCGARDLYKCIPFKYEIEHNFDYNSYTKYTVSLTAIREYPYWNTDFPDTRKPKSRDKSAYQYIKSGGSYDDITNPQDYYTMKPIEVLEGNREFLKILCYMNKLAKQLGDTDIRLYFEID